MTILSSFTHSQIVPTLYECLYSAEHREDILKNVETERFWGIIDVVVFLSYYEVNDAPNSLITNFLQNIFLCVQQNKDIHTGLELIKGE